MRNNPPQSPLVRGEVLPPLDSYSSGNLTPLNPPLSGGKLAPSPDKGRDGEGLPFHDKNSGEGLGLPFIPYNKTLITLARENRKNPTAAEQKIWQELLRMRQFTHLKFLRQKPIGNYILDFYCANLQLAIEIDGDSHAQQIEYDAERTRFLNACGIQVTRYTNDDVLHNINGVYENLKTVVSDIEDKKT